MITLLALEGLKQVLSVLSERWPDGEFYLFLSAQLRGGHVCNAQVNYTNLRLTTITVTLVTNQGSGNKCSADLTSGCSCLYSSALAVTYADQIRHLIQDLTQEMHSLEGIGGFYV